MLVGMEVGLDPGDTALDGDPTPPPKKGAQQPKFWLVYCGQMAEWIKMPLRAGVGLSPGHIVLHGDPAPPPQKRGTAGPNFWSMSIVAKWMDGARCYLVGK